MRWEIRAPWPSLAEVERRFDEILRWRWAGAVEAPPADLFVAADEVRIEMDLPGVSEEDVRVRVERDDLIIEGQRVQAPDEQSRPAAQERWYGAFQRRIPLPPEWPDVSHEVRLVSGVLRVRVRARRGGPS
jgi:HSP20 family protein